VPFERREAEPAEGNPWGSGFRHLRRSEEKEREGHEEGRNRFEDPPEKDLEGAKTQEGTVPVLTRTGWESWWVPLIPRAKTAGAPVSGRSVWQGSAGAERSRETGVQPRGRNEALKREAQERGKLKQASVGRGADAAKRVAKP
jgi:hypothetical protein